MDLRSKGIIGGAAAVAVILTVLIATSPFLRERAFGANSFSSKTLALIQRLTPYANNTVDIGSGTLAFKDLYVAGSLYASTSAWSGNLLPAANNTYDIGSGALSWKDAYVSGTVYANTNVTSSQFNAGYGSDSAPSYAFDSDSGMFRSTNNYIGFTEDGTLAMYLGGGQTINYGTLRPGSDNAYDLGASNPSFWHDLYLGNDIILKTNNTTNIGTNALAVKDIYTSGTIYFGSGSVTTPGLAAASQANTGIYFTPGLVNIASLGAQSWSFSSTAGNKSFTSLFPSLDNSFDLGSVTLRWADVFTVNLIASGTSRFGRQAVTTTIQAQTNAPAIGKGTCLAMTDTNGTQYWYSSVGGVLTASLTSCE